MSKKLLFIHVPKTGGLSIDRYLKESGVERVGGYRHHATAAEIKEIVGAEEFVAATKFAIVREPIARYQSACRQGRLKVNCLSTRLRAERDKSKRFQARLLLPQTEMLYIDGELAVDKLFKFEDDMPETVLAWLEEQGCEGSELPHLHLKPGPKFPLKESTEEWAREFYGKDIEAFEY